MTVAELAEHGIFVDVEAGTIEVHSYTADMKARGIDPAWLAEAVEMVRR